MDITKLKAMKVADLKAELDKRGLPRSGTKAVLIDRLSKALEETVVVDIPDSEDDVITADTESQNVAPKTTPAVDLAAEDREEETRATNANQEPEIDTFSDDDLEINDPDENLAQDEREKSVNSDKYDDIKSDDEPPMCDNVDSHLLSDTGIDDLDYGDDDNKPEAEDIVSFQIDESDALIVEDKKETPVKNVAEEAKSTTDKVASQKVDEKASTDAGKPVADKPKVEATTKAKATDDEGHPDILKMVWVSNLTKITRALDLKTTFGQYGKVMSAKVVMNPNAREAKCFGLVTMSKESEADTAICKLNGYMLHSREIVVARPKKDNAVLRKMRQQLQQTPKVKTSSRPAGIRPRQKSPEDKTDEKSSSRSDRDKDRRVIAGSGSTTVISVNIKPEEKSESRRERRRSRSPGRRVGSSRTSERSSRRSPERPPGTERPRSPPARRKSRSPRRRSQPRKKSRSPRARRSPIRAPPAPTRRRSRTPRRTRSPRRKSRSPKRRSRTPERRVHDPRRSPAAAAARRRSPDRRRSSRSPKRARRSPSPTLRHRSSRRSRSSERRVSSGRKTDADLELQLLREQTAKQEAAIKALMQGNVSNVGQMLGEKLTEKLAADLKSALVKQLQSTVKTMSTKTHSKNALVEVQHAQNASKIKENIERMKANGQVTTLLPPSRPAPPLDAAGVGHPPAQPLPKYNATSTLPSFNPLMVSHKQPEPASSYSSSHRSSSGSGRSDPRDTYSRSNDRHEPRHSSSGHGGHPSSGRSSHHASSSGRSDTYSNARNDPRSASSASGGQQSTQINDLLKSLQGVKEMVSKPNTYGNVQPPPSQSYVQPQTYKNVNPMMQPPPNQYPPQPQQYGNMPPMNFNPQNPQPQQWGQPTPPFSSVPPYMNSQNNQYSRR